MKGSKMKHFTAGMMLIVVMILAGCGANKPKVPEQKQKEQTENSQQTPNPRVEYTTTEEAKKAVDFEVRLPQLETQKYKTGTICVIDKKVVEVQYSQGTQVITYRTGVGSADISGDYNHYTKEESLKVGDVEVKVKGDDNGASAALWSQNDIQYSLNFTESVTLEEIRSIIERIS